MLACILPPDIPVVATDWLWLMESWALVSLGCSHLITSVCAHLRVNAAFDLCTSNIDRKLKRMCASPSEGKKNSHWLATWSTMSNTSVFSGPQHLCFDVCTRIAYALKCSSCWKPTLKSGTKVTTFSKDYKCVWVWLTTRNTAGMLNLVISQTPKCIITLQLS